MQVFPHQAFTFCFLRGAFNLMWKQLNPLGFKICVHLQRSSNSCHWLFTFTFACISFSLYFFMFSDLSDAFNTIPPPLLSEKLLRMGVSTSTVCWIADYLSARSQFVQLGSSLSDVVVINTEHRSASGDCPASITLHLTFSASLWINPQKLSADAAAVGQELENRDLLANLTERWIICS